MSIWTKFPVLHEYNTEFDRDAYYINGQSDESVTAVKLVNEGDNVAEFLGITKFEPVIPASMSGDMAYIGTDKIPHFDIENIKKFPDAFDPEEEVIVTEKLHGTFFGMGHIPGLNREELWDGDFFCYSKGLGNKGLVFKNVENNKDNLYVRQFLKIFSNLPPATSPLFIMGEIFGTGVQDLNYGMKEPSLRIFDYHCDGEWQGWDITESLAGMLNVDLVPIIFRGKFKDYDLESKNGNSTLAKHVREGVVIKPVVPRKFGQRRLILKDINEKYLTRKNPTEFS